jgi:hypothetical protein
MFVMGSQGCRLRSNPGLELANAFGVYHLEDDLQPHPRRTTTATDEIVIQKSSGGGVRYVQTG